jgi:hypothetical protein
MNTTKGTGAYKKAFDELNEKLKEHNLATLDNNASVNDITEAYKRLTDAIKANNAETARANALDDTKEGYANALDNLRKTTLEELKEAHHYNWSDILGMGWSSDSKDIQEIATPLATQINQVIEDALPKMVKLDDAKKAEAKEQLRQQITDILKDAGVDEDHAKFITKYDWLTDTFKDVFSGDGGIIDQAIKAREAFESQTDAANKAANSYKRMGDNAQDTAPKVNVATLSLDELHDIASKLDGKEVTIDCKTYGFENALSLLKAVNDEIAKHQNDLNTESGISAEIQKLKQLRGEAQLGSKAWKDYNNQITKLQTRLDNATGSFSIVCFYRISKTLISLCYIINACVIVKCR